MRVRGFVCAVLMTAIAVPATAGERVGYSAAPDALSLLLQDETATFGPRIPMTVVLSRFDAVPRIATLAEPLPDTLTRFEALMVPAGTALPAAPGVEALSFTMTTDDSAPFGGVPLGSSTFGARHAIEDAMADYPRPFRRRAMLDTMVTLRLDGEERTRSVTVGGVAGAVWGALPQR